MPEPLVIFDEAPDASVSADYCTARLAEQARPVIGAPPHTHVCRQSAGHDQESRERVLHECICGLLWWRP